MTKKKKTSECKFLQVGIKKLDSRLTVTVVDEFSLHEANAGNGHCCNGGDH